MKYILAIDPGTTESAFVLMHGDTMKPICFEKRKNEEMYADMVEAIRSLGLDAYADLHVAIEMIASYGMPVGDDVFHTVLWIGRLLERFQDFPITLIYRKDEKMTICQSMKANDATIKHALVDRFAAGVPNLGKGTKAEPGWFYGFRDDIWQAYAVGVTYHDLREGR